MDLISSWEAFAIRQSGEGLQARGVGKVSGGRHSASQFGFFPGFRDCSSEWDSDHRLASAIQKDNDRSV